MGVDVFGGTSQELVGDLIRAGITGTAGHVAEPYLGAAVRPDILFPAYVSGMNLAESFYLAIPFLSWQTVVIGDPLMAPFRQRQLTSEAIDPGPDDVTELPSYLSAHRLRVITSTGVRDEAARQALRAERRLAAGDRAGARAALEEATTLDPGYVQAEMALAGLHDAAGEWDLAIERYRRVIARAPNDAIALNNLAYALAERKGEPEEALPLAQRAYALLKGNPAVADTLGWIQHLVGNEGEAERLLAAATSGAPSAGMLVHYAIVLAAVGKPEAALQALDRAAAIDPKTAEREDVRALRGRLQGVQK
jgi:tetratricopeptide (TPR) repeat protein